MDQIFVNAKIWLIDQLPDAWRPWGDTILSITPILLLFPLLFAISTWVERKALGRIQNRLGPNRVGPFGLFQPIADGLKMLGKEDVIPRGADGLLHFLAPVILVSITLLSFAVLPYGRNMTPLPLETGILFFFAMGASSELAVFLAGWSSRNKYSLLGAMRAIAQMVSYEIPLVLSAVSVIMMSGSLSLDSIVQAQEGYHFGFLGRWHVFTPWGLLGLLLFLIATLAECNRSPFDIPEAESEIIAGHLTEYSGFKYALFFLAEYLGMFALCGLAVTLFLGGWQPLLSFLAWLPGWLWFFGKLSALVFLFIWVRGTLPRLRSDQLLQFAWKFLLPLSLTNLIMAAVWRFTVPWSFAGADAVRWIGAAICLGAAYYIFGRALGGGERTGPRQYRLVEG